MLGRLGDLLRTTFGQALVGALLLWAALPLPLWLSHLLGPISPNVDTWRYPGMDAPLPGPWFLTTAWLAWIGPAFWVLLARRRELPGRRPYRALWLVGFLFWLAELYWLTLPYWATSLGWVALSFYLAFYLPVFVGLVRVAVHRLRVSVILAAPVVWMGLELARGHMLTGFTMASLGHTQYRWLELIQLSDLAGMYGVGFVVMLVAACLARMVPLEAPFFHSPGDGGRETADSTEARPHHHPLPEGEGARWRLWPLAPAAATLAAALLYGHWRLGEQTVAEEPPPLARIALIQGSIDVEVKSDPKKQRAIMKEYVGLSQRAAKRYGRLDLMVWPETMFRAPLYTFDDKTQVPSDWPDSPEEYHEWVEEVTTASPGAMAELATRLGAPLLLGVDAYHVKADGADSFNSAAFVDRSGKIVARYDKTHPVVFGEYIPFARYVPWLARLTPIGPGLTQGRQPVAVRAGPVVVAPNICYESVLSHVIRRLVNSLTAEGREPDVLVNLTNDGWYYGANELDLHLVCGVFRAVECRKPFLSAANTGFSASIDGDGRIVSLGPRRAPATVLAEVRRDPRRSWYLRHGDWPASVCLGACVVLATVGLWHLRKTAAASH